MKRTLLLPLVSAALLSSVLPSHAALTAFTDYEYGGINASWDIFYGASYQTSYSQATDTLGNPSSGTTPLTLTALQTSHSGFPGYQGPTGPIDTDGGTVPGDREQYYTFFSNQTWGVSGTVTGETTVFTLQMLGEATFNNVTLNTVMATGSFDDASGVTTWTWSGLDLEDGDSFNLGWTTGAHNVIDAIQIQTGVVPEPSAFALIGLGLATAAFRRRRA